MVDVIKIPTLVNYGTSHTRDRWGRSGTIIFLINHWSKFPLEQISQFKKNTPGYSTLDVVRSEWLFDFYYNSSTEELHSHVNNIYYMFD